jgi:hypothetical protein
MSIRITCIQKSGGYHADPHHAITSLGWTNEQTGAIDRSTRENMYDWVKKGGVAVVRDAYGHVAQVRAREHVNGTHFVQTYADGIFTDNLLALPECR